MESEQVTARPLSSNALHWARILRNYREPNHGRSIYEIGATLVPFLGFWALAWAAIHFGYWELSPIPHENGQKGVCGPSNEPGPEVPCTL